MFESPCVRRRVLRALAVVAAVGTVAVAAWALPSAHSSRATLREGAPQRVRTPPAVRLSSARRRMIDKALDTFVPAAVERRAPLRALPLVTPAFRAGQTRADWAHGNLPVQPFRARDRRFHGWRLDYSYPNEISVDLLLQPAPTEQLGAISFTAVFKRTHGRWLIDSFVPAAIFAGKDRPPRILAEPDFTPNTATPVGSARLKAPWLLVPVVLLALILIVPAAFGIAYLRRSRRAMRDYHAAS